MKKLLKFFGGIASMAAVAFGAYCVYKKVFTKKEEEPEEFDDCFEDESAEDSDREYVSITITADGETTEEESESSEEPESETPEEEKKEDAE